MCGIMSSKRFVIAFSFAGEKRNFVKATADLLAARFGEEKILYDKFHEAEFARNNLGIYLPKLYGEESELIVPVICPNYDPKRWTGWEWMHIYGLLTKANGHRVMPSRFQKASVDGLSSAAGFIELDKKDPEEFEKLILERLALNEGKPKNFYLGKPVPVAKPADEATSIELLDRSPATVNVRLVEVMSAVMDPVHMRNVLMHEAEETYERKLKDIENVKESDERERLRQGEQFLLAQRKAYVEVLLPKLLKDDTSADITPVHREMNRILQEEGVDKALAYLQRCDQAIVHRAEVLKHAKQG
ncbi:MAG TPA: hypothetical protein PK760_11295, partial [Flavobacteriales bacterium]|nr:hypothetical protein [Flavobacteriales bacterium]